MDFMTIGELAEMSGASARSIRYYEAAGLLTPKRLSNSYREFDRADIETVKQIGLLLQLGFLSRRFKNLLLVFPRALRQSPSVKRSGQLSFTIGQSSRGDIPSLENCLRRSM